MDHLHRVIRSLRSEPQPRDHHLAVFREFLRHLDRVAENAAKDSAKRRCAVKDAKPNGKRP